MDAVYRMSKNKSCSCPFCRHINYPLVTRKLCKHLVTITKYGDNHPLTSTFEGKGPVYRYEFVPQGVVAYQRKLRLKV